MGDEPSVAPGADAGQGDGGAGWRPYAAAIGAAAVVFIALGTLFLLPYRVNDLDYPVGFDSPFYVWRSQMTASQGLDPIGTVRSGTPLLMATIMGVTGENGFTAVVVVPVVLAGVAALGAAAMVRAGTGMGVAWVPVVAVMTWIGFGRIGMIGGHHDNVMNAALVLPAFGAACAAAGAGGRGAVAVAILMAAAGLAHWPFYLYAAAVFVFALAIFAFFGLRSGRASMATPVRLLAALGASGAFTALTFLAPPPGGGLIKLNPNLLYGRFLNRLRAPTRYLAVPLAAGGAWAVLRTRVAPARSPARLLLVAILASWAVSMVAAGLVQLLGVPVAGSRLLNYFFVVPLLAGVFLVWASRWLIGRGWLGVAGAMLLLLVAMTTFGRLAWEVERKRRPWVETEAISQAASAGAYLSRYAPEGRVVFVLSRRGPVERKRPGHRWHVLRTGLPADQVHRATWTSGSPSDYLAPMGGGETVGTDGEPVVIVLRRYNQAGFLEALSLGAPVAAPGVAILEGPSPAAPLPAAPVPRANTSPAGLVGLGALVAVLLLVAGSGWSVALLPPDAVVRVSVAPGLGAASLTLVALGWDRLGLGLWGPRAFGPLVLCVAGGWAAAAWRGRRGSIPPRGGIPEPAKAAGGQPMRTR
jgi:hypothetical protein